MRDSMTPDPGSGTRKTVIFLLGGGMLLMAAAGIILYLRSADSPSPPSTKPTKEVPLAVKPLIAVPQHGPLLAATDPEAETDAPPDTAAEVQDREKTKKKGVVAATGKIDAKAVNIYINNHFGQVKACYERRLKINSLLEGKLDLNIGISTSGKVSTVTVNNDTVRDAEMLSCVKTVIRGWEFSKPEGGRVVIAKTFNFKKKDR